MDWKLECERFKAENEQLRAENHSLKMRLGIERNDCAPQLTHITPPCTAVHMQSAPDEKIALFRSLFHGREDVYAKRWYSEKLQKGGYAPVCENKWREGLCDKKAYKCAKCPNRKLAKLTDKAIFMHLSCKDSLASDVIGIYPMLPEETCLFLAIDFDEEN